MKVTLSIILGVLALLILTVAWFSYPWSLHEFRSVKEVTHVETEEMVETEEKPAVIKILTWNLGFLYGEGSEGPGYELKPKKYFDERLDSLVKTIQEAAVDVVFLQEIDFESDRSHGVDQAKYLAMKGGYPFVAEAVSWEANYIPFPYWPFSRHFGRMKSGGAVLSKYPIVKNDVILLEKPLSQPWWYNLFYLHRYFQKVTISINGRDFQVINLHLEAFDKKDRLKQIQKLVEIEAAEKIDFIAGDFNMVPTEATKKSKFYNDDDYENDPSFSEMGKSGMKEVIPEDIYMKEENLYFTFPSWKPDRRLDYIFYQQDLKMMRAEVLPSALSDHLPIKASFQINSPQINPYSL